MENFILSCCSTADLSRQHFLSRKIHYICFHFELDGRQYADDLGVSIPFPQFYQSMRDGAETRTSQVNVDEYIAYFEPFLKAGQDIFHVCLSSGLSGTLNSAVIAQAELAEKYPERKIYVLDSLGASSGYGLLMETLADLRDGGMDLDSLYRWAEEHRLELHHWFFSSDLTFYVRGGRISRASGFLGNALGICPLLNMNALGQLIPRYKIFGRKKVIRIIVDKMAENARDGLDYSGKCFLSHSDCPEDARAVAELVESRFPKLTGKVVVNNVGTTIGSHTGPGTVALFFWGGVRV